MYLLELQVVTGAVATDTTSDIVSAGQGSGSGLQLLASMITQIQSNRFQTHIPTDSNLRCSLAQALTHLVHASIYHLQSAVHP